MTEAETLARARLLWQAGYRAFQMPASHDIAPHDRAIAAVAAVLDNRVKL